MSMAFKNWVHDEQEKAMQRKWQEFVDEGNGPITFEQFCSDFDDKYDPTE